MAFDFLIRASVQGDVAAIARLERLQGALRMVAASAAAGSARQAAVQQALSRADRALATAQGNMLARQQMTNRGLGPAAPGPFGGMPPARPPIIPAGGNTWGGGIGRFFGGGTAAQGGGGGIAGRIGSGAMNGLFGGGLPMHVKAFFNVLMGARAIQGVASLSKAAGNIAAVSGTFNELNGGAVEGAKKMKELAKLTGNIIPDKLLSQGAAAIQGSGAKNAATGADLGVDDLAPLLKGVVRLGRVPGFTPEESVDRLRNAVTTGSTAGLDKILPGFDADLAIRNFMDNNDMDKDEVDNTPGLQQTIIVDAIRQALEQNLARVPEAALAKGDSFDKLAAAAENAKNKLILNVGGSEEFQSAVESLTRQIENAVPGLERFAKNAATAIASEDGQAVGMTLGAAAMGGKAGMMLGGPWGAAYGSLLGAGMATGAIWGDRGAEAGASALKRLSGEARHGVEFAEGEGFDQADYDKKQAAFVERLARMDNEQVGAGGRVIQSSEYQAYKNSAEGRGTREKNAAEAMQLLAPMSVRVTDAFRGMLGAVVSVSGALSLLVPGGTAALAANSLMQEE